MNARKLILRLFASCPHGTLTLRIRDEAPIILGKGGTGIRAEVSVRDEAFFNRLLFGADIGLGEAYIDGLWDSPSATDFIRWLIQNRNHLTSSGSSWLLPLLNRLNGVREWIQNRRNANTLEGSRRNIEAHYDLGNDFYELFLDESMTYSSAFFTEPEQKLAAAQTEKYDRICRKLALNPSDSVLEIGCGWGGFAEHAARNYGCKITGVTISPSQYEYAVERMERNGLEKLVEIRLQDYRTIKGRFDKVASIEMIEAVGHEYLPGYFSAIDRLLAPDGLACIQIITSADERYRRYVRDSDYIRKHIFPGSNLPSLAAVFDAKGTSNLNLYHMESFGLHYAKTLRVWRERFAKRWPTMRELGFSEAFRRKWELYFDYCEAGFLERHINVAQVVFGRSNTSLYQFELDSYDSGSNAVMATGQMRA